MKKTLVLLTCAAAVSAFSQGTVNFVTRNTGAGVNALIQYTNSASDGVVGPILNGAKPSAVTDNNGWGGINARAGLYGAANGTPRDGLVLLVPSIGFRTGAAAGFVDPGSTAERTIQGVPGGAMATFQVRAWDTGTAGVDTYEAAVGISTQRKVYLGESPLLPNIILGNDTSGGTPTLPANLAGLVGFSMDFVGVPEPSIIGLGILGALAGLFVFRRRN
jgi:hypothetical protein